MTSKTSIDASRRMGTAVFKKEINHLLHTSTHSEFQDGLNTGWNSGDHALVMALMLKRQGRFPDLVEGKCMFVQGPYLNYSSIGVGQDSDSDDCHHWLQDPQFGLIDVSPILEIRKHRFRAAFDGIFGRVWLPSGKNRVHVIECDSPQAYGNEIDKASHLTGQSTAIYLKSRIHEITGELIDNPFPMLKSDLAEEIKKRFGAGFYPAIARHMQAFMLGKTESLTLIPEIEAWSTVLDRYGVSKH